MEFCLQAIAQLAQLNKNISGTLRLLQRAVELSSGPIDNRAAREALPFGRGVSQAKSELAPLACH
jgi:hypothetical protein